VTRSVGTDAYDATAFRLRHEAARRHGLPGQREDRSRGADLLGLQGRDRHPAVATDALRVGCEYTYDHVSRSTDDAVLGTYFESSAPVIGGSSTALGRHRGRLRRRPRSSPSSSSAGRHRRAATSANRASAGATG